MAGKKGRSGRRTLLNEKKTEEICQLSEDIILEWLNNTEVETHRKIAVVKEIFLKRMPTKVEGDGFNTNIQNIINRIQQDFYESRKTPLGLDSGDGLDKGRTRSDEPDKEIS